MINRYEMQKKLELSYFWGNKPLVGLRSEKPQRHGANKRHFLRYKKPWELGVDVEWACSDHRKRAAHRAACCEWTLLNHAGSSHSECPELCELHGAASSGSHHVTTAPYHQELHLASGQWPPHTGWSLLPLPHFRLPRWTQNLFVHVEPSSAKSCKSPSNTKDRHPGRGCRAAILWEPEAQVLTTIFTVCQRALTSPAPSEWLWRPFESQGQALWIHATKSTRR